MKRPTTVMLVDDDSWLVGALSLPLEKSGYTVVSASHSALALQMIDENKPDVIVADMLLAGGTVFTLLHELQSYDDTRTIPVVLCSNVVDQIKDIDVSAYGVKEVLDKATMQPDDIVTAVRKVLQ